MFINLFVDDVIIYLRHFYLTSYINCAMINFNQ